MVLPDQLPIRGTALLYVLPGRVPELLLDMERTESLAGPVELSKEPVLDFDDLTQGLFGSGREFGLELKQS